MIKIEKLLDNAKATFTRENKQMPVFLNQLLSDQEGTTLVVTQGTLVYTIDETEIVTVSAGELGKELNLNIDTKSTVESTDTVDVTSTTTETPSEEVVETPVETVVETAPKTVEIAPALAPIIVKPAPRKK